MSWSRIVTSMKIREWDYFWTMSIFIKSTSMAVYQLQRSRRYRSKQGNVRNMHITGCDIESNMGVNEPPTANVLIDCSDSLNGTAEVAITGRCTIQHNSTGKESANIRILGRSNGSTGNDGYSLGKCRYHWQCIERCDDECASSGLPRSDNPRKYFLDGIRT